VEKKNEWSNLQHLPKLNSTFRRNCKLKWLHMWTFGSCKISKNVLTLEVRKLRIPLHLESKVFRSIEDGKSTLFIRREVGINLKALIPCIKWPLDFETSDRCFLPSKHWNHKLSYMVVVMATNWYLNFFTEISFKSPIMLVFLLGKIASVV
jgi:hypothetical protein